MRFVHFSLLLAPLLLAGCDGERAVVEQEPVDVVGTWASEHFRQIDLLTLRSVQSITDPSRPGVGAIRITGAFEGEARYAFVQRAQDGALYAMAYTFEHTSRPWSTAGAFLRVAPNDISVVYANVVPEKEYASEDLPAGTLVVTSNEIRIARTVLSASDGSTVTVEGTLRPATMALPAGRESVVRTYTDVVTFAGQTLDVTFRADGTYAQQYRGFDGDAGPVVGTWTRSAPDSVRIALRWYGFTYAVHREGEALVLGITRDGCPYSDVQRCLRYREERFNLPSGSLTQHRERFESVMQPAQ
ncbi:MAG: hypothetical protein IAE99_00090 [Rhodothermales bacterium]|nr:hypothetical protein [Rhodothermales bacterium]